MTRVSNMIASCGLLVVLLLAGCSEKDGAVGIAAPATAKLDPAQSRTGMLLADWPREVGASTQFDVKGKLMNLGATLPESTGPVEGALQVNITYHWLDPEGKPVIWDGVRTSLGAALEIGQGRDFVLKVVAPPTPGRYILETDLVQEGEFWFGPTGSQTARVLVQVN